jgi:hypothetical protein
VAGFYEHGDKHSSSIKGRKFLNELEDHQLLKNDSNNDNDNVLVMQKTGVSFKKQ